MSYLRLSPNLFQMLAVCVVFSGFLLNSHLAAVAQYLSGTESTSLASSNHSFENELNGWDHTSQLAAQLLVRSWAPDLSDRFEPYFGNNLVRLRGEGSWGQTVPLQAGIQQQVLNGFAFKQSNQSGKAPGFAAVAVTYYDAFWCELDRIVIPIDEKLPNSLSVVYSDAKGIDLSSIDFNDVYFSSKTDPTDQLMRFRYLSVGCSSGACSQLSLCLCVSICQS